MKILKGFAKWLFRMLIPMFVAAEMGYLIGHKAGGDAMRCAVMAVTVRTLQANDKTVTPLSGCDADGVVVGK